MVESVILSPKSIAVIGASDKKGSVGATITSNIMNGFKGTVFPISPSRDTVFYKKSISTIRSTRTINIDTNCHLCITSSVLHLD